MISPTDNLYQRVLVLILAVGGNLFLVWLFSSALLYPLQHTELIFQTGIWIFLIEFMGISSGKLLLRGISPIRKIQEILSFLVFAAFAFGFGIVLRNLYYPTIFIISFAAKSFGNRATPGHSKTASNILIFLVSLAIVFFLFSPKFWISQFPFPEKVFDSMPDNLKIQRIHGGSSGEFIDHPQTLLIWGALYYSLLAALEIAMFWRNKIILKRQTKKLPEESFNDQNSFQQK